MSATATALEVGRDWSARGARWLLVAVPVTTIAIGPPPFLTVFGSPAPTPPFGHAAVVFPLALGILALQLRHSFAIARGERPRGVLWTLLAQAVLVYLPLHWFGWTWLLLQATLMASLPLVLRGWPLAAAVAAPLVATDVVAAALAPVLWSVSGLSEVGYWTIRLGLLAAGLYGSARLVRLLGELQETRAELAALAVGRERLRVSRDLHDLLGQSLSAVALKGDLAIRLLRSDPPAARTEIEGLTGLARETIRGLHAVSRDEHAVSLQAETEGASALLAAAGIRARVDLELPDLAPAVERMLAWAVREGIANVLRHSEARTCSITGGRRDGNVRLEIVNDGAPAPAAEGSGLAGLRERARALSGSVAARHTADGEFRLLVEVPEEA